MGLYVGESDLIVARVPDTEVALTHEEEEDRELAQALALSVQDASGTQDVTGGGGSGDSGMELS